MTTVEKLKRTRPHWFAVMIYITIAFIVESVMNVHYGVHAYQLERRIAALEQHAKD